MRGATDLVVIDLAAAGLFDHASRNDPLAANPLAARVPTGAATIPLTPVMLRSVLPRKPG